MITQKCNVVRLKKYVLKILFQGNKGASTVRLDFKGVNIVVVNCHLPAHREEVMARIEVSLILIYLKAEWFCARDVHTKS